MYAGLSQDIAFASEHTLLYDTRIDTHTLLNDPGIDTPNMHTGRCVGGAIDETNTHTYNTGLDSGF